jgi:hypothetical protein
MSKIDLRKGIVQQIAVSKNLTDLRAQVVIVLDRSGSMEDLYKTGFVQRLLERLVPVAMQFDDNGEMEMYLFQNSCVKFPTGINERNVDGLINREITDSRYSYGGTAYAPPINQIVRDYVQVEKSGFLGLGKTTGNVTDPVYVIFITDGENSDKPAAEKAITEASKYGIFFQFVGIGKATFSFLDKLDTLTGRTVDNANFFQANDLDSLSDTELYERLFAEFPEWVDKARNLRIIK